MVTLAQLVQDMEDNNVVRIAGSKELVEQKTGDTHIFEFYVLIIANADGAQSLQTQTIYVKDYQGPGEEAKYGERVVKNYVPPDAENDSIVEIKAYLDNEIALGNYKAYFYNKIDDVPNNRKAGLFKLIKMDDTEIKVVITKSLDGNVLILPAEF